MKAVVVPFYLALALSVACDDENPPAVLAPPCDISEAACQRGVFQLTASVRGQEGAELPPIRVISRDQLRDEIEASLQGGGDPAPEDVAVQKAFALLNLLPGETGAADEAIADDLAEGIAAYYSQGSKSITVIADAAENHEDGTFVLSHEFVHALQDQRGDFALPSSFDDTTDAHVSFDSLIEGEAVWLSNVAMAEAEGGELDGAKVETYFDTMRANILASVAESDAPLYLAGEILPYPLGGRGVFHAYEGDDLAGIEALHDETPLSLAYWIEHERGEITCAVPEAPAGFSELTSDRLGVVGMVALDTALSQTTPTFALAEAWVDDRIALYTDDAFKKVGLAYRIRFDSDDQALALSTRLLESPVLSESKLDARVEGTELLVLAANTQELLDALSAAQECAVPKRAKRPGMLLAAARRWKTFRQ